MHGNNLDEILQMRKHLHGAPTAIDPGAPENPPDPQIDGLITDSNAAWPANLYIGATVTLANGQNVHTYNITANTATALTVEYDSTLSEFTTTGTTYEITAIYTYATDAQGNVVALTREDGTILEKIKYDVYGRLTGFEYWNGAGYSNGDDNEDGFVTAAEYYACSLTKNPYLFQGQRLDEETGLYYFKNRYYDPVHGRFISRDPAGEGVNLYAFVNNNPINFVDPYGLDAQITWTEDNDAQVKSLKAALQNLIDAGKVQYYDKSWRSSGFFLVADTPGYVLLEKGKDLTLNDLTNALKDKYDTVFINRLYASMVREFESRDLKWSDTDKGATVEAPSLDERALTIRERDICGSMFGSTVAYDAVTIHMTSKLGQPGITLDNDIYMDPNNADIQSTWDSTLVHEMTHVWQYQRLTGGRTKWICLLGYIGDRRSRPRVGGNSS